MAAPDLELKKAFSELQAKMIETKQVISKLPYFIYIPVDMVPYYPSLNSAADSKSFVSDQDPTFIY